jgi:hypothetical protein
VAQVRAVVAHIQPGTLEYRDEGEEFVYDGKPYKHVEVVKQKPTPRAEQEETASDNAPATVTKKPIR